MLPGRVYTPALILWILRRRLWLLLACVLVGGLAAARLALTAPDVYSAQTTIFVAPPRMPESYIRPVVSESLEQRLLTITPQILNPARLERIITELDLYPELRKTAPIEYVIEAMRRSITGPTVVRADAFRIGYHGYWPEKVMLVTQRLGALFIDENLRNRQKAAADTSEFLESQLEETRSRLMQQERALQEYRTRNAPALPSQMAANLQVLESTQERLYEVQASLRQDRERRLLVEEPLLVLEGAPETAAAAAAPIEPEPDLPASPDTPAAAERTATPAPADGAEIEPDLNFGPPGTPHAVRLESARRYLQSLQLRRTAAHPDVQRAQRIVAELEKAALEQTARAGRAAAAPGASGRAAAIALARRQLAAIDTEIAGKVAEEGRLRRAVAEYQHRVDSGPAHDAKLTELTRDYDIIRESYRALLAKKEESGIAADLERQQASEQFRIVEPARLPVGPAAPNRPRMVLVGIGLGLAVGLALTMLLELRDRSFRTAPEVVHALSLPVLAMVPTISTRYERRLFIRRLALGVGLLALVALVGGGVLVLRGGW